MTVSKKAAAKLMGMQFISEVIISGVICSFRTITVIKKLFRSTLKAFITSNKMLICMLAELGAPSMFFCA